MQKLLERMELEVETVELYGSICYRVAGKVENLKRKAAEFGQRWVSGQEKSRWVLSVFGPGREFLKNP